MILAEIDCSTAHSISLFLAVTPSADNRTVANDLDWANHSLEISSWLYI